MLYIDERRGGQQRWSLGKPKDWDMRVPDDLLRCVFFLGTRNAKGEPVWRGTGFFLSVPLEGREDRKYVYIVTARHSLDVARDEQAQVCMRMNKVDGGSEVIDLQLTWVVDEDDLGSDVAIAGVSIGDAERLADYTTIPHTMLVTDQIAADEGIGIGDELAVVGLFTKRAGVSRSHPIVRFGTIAAMPGEPLTNPRTKAPFKGYLMELRSLVGLSGSPVFAVLPFGRLRQNADQTFTVEKAWRFYLLGLLFGHWPISADEYIQVAADALDLHEPLNTGIGIVYPATGILDLLNREDLVEKRKEGARRENLKEAPQMDMAKVPEPSMESREEFEDALRKVSRRKALPPDEGTSGT